MSGNAIKKQRVPNSERRRASIKSVLDSAEFDSLVASESLQGLERLLPALVDGVARIKPLVKRAAEQDMPAIALTDQSNMFALVRFYKAAMAAGVKPIAGVDAWVRNPDDGSLWGTIPIPRAPANCAFGDADKQTLYITAREGLYRVRLPIAGI